MKELLMRIKEKKGNQFEDREADIYSCERRVDQGNFKCD